MTPVAICRQFPLCCWHRWQIMGTISGCRHLKENLKAKIYIYVNSTTQRCPIKIIKIFLLEDFFHLPPVSLTPVVHLEPRISPWIIEKIRNVRNGILRCLGETVSWKKNQKSKVSWHCPFNSWLSCRVCCTLVTRLLEMHFSKKRESCRSIEVMSFFYFQFLGVACFCRDTNRLWCVQIQCNPFWRFFANFQSVWKFRFFWYPLPTILNKFCLNSYKGR
jgi:hypothetical protein